MQKTRVAFFIDSLKEHQDGVSNTSHQIIRKINENNLEAIFITSMPPTNPAFGFPVYQTRYVSFPYTPEYRFALPSKRKLFKILDDFKPDLVHWSSPSLLGKLAIKYAKKRDIPNVAIYHTHFVSYIEYFKWLQAKSFLTRFTNRSMLKLYRNTDATLAPTKEMMAYLSSIGMPDEKIVLWGRGVDCRLFHPEKKPENFFEYQKGEKVKNVLFVSRLVHYKETDLLIELSHHLPKGINLVIVGEGPEQEKMKTNSNPDNTYFLGKLSGEELAKAYASCDLFVFPSLSETFGNVVLEAMASGLPVVAANSGGPKNIIRDGDNGFLVKPKSLEALKEKTLLLAQDEDLLNKMSANAREYAESQSWTNLIQLLVRIYHGCIKKKQHSLSTSERP